MKRHNLQLCPKKDPSPSKRQILRLKKIEMTMRMRAMLQRKRKQITK